MKIEKKEESDLEKFLGRPVIDDFSENAHRVRRNLLVFSSIALFWKFTGAEVGEAQNIFGLGLKGIEDFHISIGLAIVVFYHFIHFTLFVIEHYRRSIVRLSGRFIDFVQTRLDESSVTKKEKTDLYQLICEELSFFSELKENKKKIEENLKIYEESFNSSETETIRRCHQKLEQVVSAIKEINEILTRFDNELKPRLTSFEKGYGEYKRPERIRWIVIEYGLPLLIGFAAFLWLILSLFCSL